MGRLDTAPRKAIPLACPALMSTNEAAWEANIADASGRARSTGPVSSPRPRANVRQYVIEQDPPVEPFSLAAESFEYVNCLVF